MKIIEVISILSIFARKAVVPEEKNNFSPWTFYKLITKIAFSTFFLLIDF